jgi:hypothetical protein
MLELSSPSYHIACMPSPEEPSVACFVEARAIPGEHQKLKVLSRTKSVASGKDSCIVCEQAP